MVARSQRLPKISVLCFVRPQDLASFRSQTNQHPRRCQLSVMWRSELRQARYGANLRGQPAPHNPSSRLIPTTTVYLSEGSYSQSFSHCIQSWAHDSGSGKTFISALQETILSKQLHGSATVLCSAPDGVWLAASQGSQRQK